MIVQVTTSHNMFAKLTLSRFLIACNCASQDASAVCRRFECVRDVFNQTSDARSKNRRAGIIEHKFEPSGVQAVYKVTVTITRTGLDPHIDHTTDEPIEGPPFEVCIR